MISQVKNEERQRELEFKKVELGQMEQKRQEHEEYQRMLREEEKGFKKYMAENYSNTVKAAKEKEKVINE